MKPDSSDPPIDLSGTSITGTTPASDASRADADAPSIPGYRLLSEIHRGGQGVVYLASEESTGRRVALKAMRDGPLAGQRERLRFEREIRILAQLRHPGIVAIHARGRAAGVEYFVMEYISGRDLKEHVDGLPERSDANTGQKHGAHGGITGQKPGATAATKLQTILVLFAEICDAVDVAHQHGIVHRDLKPSNVRVDLDGRPHLLDFGLARVLAPLSPEAVAVTRTGDFMGSLPWTSPEQAGGSAGHVDARSDVYSLGVILFQLLTGRFPYDVMGSMPDVVRSITTTEPRRPRSLSADIPAEVESIVLKCLKKSREERYFCAGALATDIRRYLAGEPIQASSEGMTERTLGQARMLAARQPVALALVMMIAAIALSTGLAVILLLSAPSMNDGFERLVAKSRANLTDNKFQHVRLIAFDDAQGMDALAARLGLRGVDAARNRVSVRRVHGALMEKLASAGPVVVAWDIRFAEPSEFDEDLARGARAIIAAGGDVVMRTKDWRLRPDGRPAFIDSLQDAGVKWGATMGTFDDAPWELELVLQPRQSEAMPSLALAACMARAAPAEALTVNYESDRIRALQATSRVSPHPRRGATNLLPTYRLSTEEFQHVSRDELAQGDRVGILLVTVSPDSRFAEATLEYERVFQMSANELREWIGGRILLVGDLTPETNDFHYYPPNRMLPGVYAHVAGIEALQRGSMFVLAGAWERVALSATAALAGILSFRRWDRRTRRLLLALILSGIILFVAAWACGVFFRFVCHPLIPWMAFAVAMGLATVVHRALRLTGGRG